MNVPDIPGSQV